jgi:hypothetical protein
MLLLLLQLLVYFLRSLNLTMTALLLADVVVVLGFFISKKQIVWLRSFRKYRY